eukprot:CFRG5104T1
MEGIIDDSVSNLGYNTAQESVVVESQEWADGVGSCYGVDRSGDRTSTAMVVVDSGLLDRTEKKSNLKRLLNYRLRKRRLNTCREEHVFGFRSTDAVWWRRFVSIRTTVALLFAIMMVILGVFITFTMTQVAEGSLVFLKSVMSQTVNYRQMDLHKVVTKLHESANALGSICVLLPICTTLFGSERSPLSPYVGPDRFIQLDLLMVFRPMQREMYCTSVYFEPLHGHTFVQLIVPWMADNGTVLGSKRVIKSQGPTPKVSIRYIPFSEYDFMNQYYFRAIKSGLIVDTKSEDSTQQYQDVPFSSQTDWHEQVAQDFGATNVSEMLTYKLNKDRFVNPDPYKDGRLIKPILQTIWVDDVIFPSKQAVLASTVATLTSPTGDIEMGLLVGSAVRTLFDGNVDQTDVSGVIRAACLNQNGIVLYDEQAVLDGDSDYNLASILSDSFISDSEIATSWNNSQSYSIGEHYTNSKNTLLRAIVTNLIEIFGTLYNVNHDTMYQMNIDGNNYLAKTAVSEYVEVASNGTVQMTSIIQVVYANEEMISEKAISARDRYIVLMWVGVIVIIIAACALAVAVTVPLEHQSRALELLSLMMEPSMVNVPIDSMFWEVRKLQINLKNLVDNSRLYSTIKASLLLLRDDMTIAYANGHFYSSFEVSSREESNEWISELFEQNTEIATNTVKLFAHEIDTFEVEDAIVIKEKTFYITLIGSRCPVRRTPGVLFAIENFTKQYGYQKQLKEAIEQAERANKAKTEFLGHMTHELRTPLSGVIGIVDLILDTRLTEHQQSLLNSIEFSANVLLSLISDILDITKIEAGAVELETAPIDILALMETVCTSFQHANKKNMDVLCFVDPRLPRYLSGDALRITQIMNNLVSNACKFTTVGSVILSANLMRPVFNQEACIQITCQDTGIGLTPEQMEKVFDALYQAQPNGPNGGTGLGLSISTALAKMMNRNGLGVTSAPGVGSTFFFDVTLPLSCSNKISYEEMVMSDHFKNTIFTAKRSFPVSDQVPFLPLETSYEASSVSLLSDAVHTQCKSVGCQTNDYYSTRCTMFPPSSNEWVRGSQSYTRVGGRDANVNVLEASSGPSFTRKRSQKIRRHSIVQHDTASMHESHITDTDVGGDTAVDGRDVGADNWTNVIDNANDLTMTQMALIPRHSQLYSDQNKKNAKRVDSSTLSTLSCIIIDEPTPIKETRCIGTQSDPVIIQNQEVKCLCMMKNTAARSLLLKYLPPIWSADVASSLQFGIQLLMNQERELDNTDVPDTPKEAANILLRHVVLVLIDSTCFMMEEGNTVRAGDTPAMPFVHSTRQQSRNRSSRYVALDSPAMMKITGHGLRCSKRSSLSDSTSISSGNSINAATGLYPTHIQGQSGAKTSTFDSASADENGNTFDNFGANKLHRRGGSESDLLRKFRRTSRDENYSSDSVYTADAHEKDVQESNKTMLKNLLVHIRRNVSKRERLVQLAMKCDNPAIVQAVPRRSYVQFMVLHSRTLDYKQNSVSSWFQGFYPNAVKVVYKPLKYHHLIEVLALIHAENDNPDTRSLTMRRNSKVNQQGQSLADGVASRVKVVETHGEHDMFTNEHLAVDEILSSWDMGYTSEKISTRASVNEGISVVDNVGIALTNCLQQETQPMVVRSSDDFTWPPGLNVLLCEDNKINIRVASCFLQRLQAPYFVAETGGQALEIMTCDRPSPHNGNYHLILMDIQMPDMDGTEATKAIRKYELEQRERGVDRAPVFIVCMTANVLNTTVDECIAECMDAYLPKPLRKKDFNRKMEEFSIELVHRFCQK